MLLLPAALEAATPLPGGVKAVWDPDRAYRERTGTRERICLNGLWRWQPALTSQETIPIDHWGYFKVPGSWPGITNYMQKDSQRVFAHSAWQSINIKDISSAWYQREITVPAAWAGRRITIRVEYVNSYALVLVDGKRAGEIRFPGGEVDISSVSRPGQKHLLSLLVIAMPLKAVMLSYNDTASAREVKGAVARRGLCGDVYLAGLPIGARIEDVKVDTSFRRQEIAVHAALSDLEPGGSYRLHARVLREGRPVYEFESRPFGAPDVKAGYFSFAASWKPDRLWDLHTPKNQCEMQVSLSDSGGPERDVFLPVRFGFREFWIEGKDFYLNGSRIYLSAVPLDNAHISVAAATYEAVRETLERLKSFGINFVYMHNYGCEPGSHLGFAEILRAADDAGMLVALSQPHFGHYDWSRSGADRDNGYARHAEYYVGVAQNHPSVVMYSMSHNATGYAEDMNPEMIDGIYDRRDKWSLDNSKKALRAEAIVKRLDPGRIIYHHSNLHALELVELLARPGGIEQLGIHVALVVDELRRADGQRRNLQRVDERVEDVGTMAGAAGTNL